MLQRFQRIRETDMKKLILITGILLSTSLWAEQKFCDIEYELDINRRKPLRQAFLAPCDVFDTWVRWEMGQVGI